MQKVERARADMDRPVAVQQHLPAGDEAKAPEAVALARSADRRCHARTPPYLWRIHVRVHRSPAKPTEAPQRGDEIRPNALFDRALQILFPAQRAGLSVPVYRRIVPWCDAAYTKVYSTASRAPVGAVLMGATQPRIIFGYIPAPGTESSTAEAEGLGSCEMTAYSGHAFTVLREGELTLYRGSGAGAPILLVTPVAERPALDVLRRLEHEYRLRSELGPEWAARPVELTQRNGRPALILEDPGGEPLDRLIGQPMEIALFLRLAISLATALRRVHERHLIHKDIKPANMLVDVLSGAARLTGFGIASALPREYQTPEPPEVIDGTLAYMAPEQTGRMNRSVDSRSDLYALGVTFHEMLTGELPFAAVDPMAWVHSHIARQPVPPHERVPVIPRPLSSIVTKLLAKTAEDRYQTAAGVVADLQRCLNQWQETRRIDSFALGANDASDRLMIPERLYGRETESATLRAAFSRVLGHGAIEFVLISGYSGIGKSSLVNEVQKDLVLSRGLFAVGKFDQYKRNIPYATVAQAFQGLVYQILGKSDAELEHWRVALLEALGPNGQLMTKLIPELALIIGEQAPAPELAPKDQQARFHLVLRRFLSVFAQPERPLVLFLDDLQWIDPATLDLIEHLVAQPEVCCLLLIGAYRNNEVHRDHPLAGALPRLRESRDRVREIQLSPLSPVVVDQLMADTFHTDPARVEPLASLVYEKTAGNPFFVIQFLNALAHEALLGFDRESRAWRWDLPRIRAKGFTDNVADLMAEKIGRLAPATQDALGQLACLGNVAEITVLASAHAANEEALRAALWEAERAGLVGRSDSTYRFLHDRIEEAAYALIAPDERAKAHLRLGRLLLEQTAGDALEDGIFDIVNQFDRGSALITTEEERKRVAELNLMAGLRAKAAAAHQSALRYFRSGRALLGGDAWERHYRLAFDLELHSGECEYLASELAAAEVRLLHLSEQALTTVDFAAVTSLRLYLYTILDRSDEAIAVGLEYVQRQGTNWSPHPTEEDVHRACNLLWQRLEATSIEALLDLPQMIDADCRATMRVLAGLFSPAQFTDLNLYRLIIIRMATLSLEHGNTDQSCVAYVNLGSLLGNYWGEPEVGYRVGRLGVDLAERSGFDHLKGVTYSLFALHVAHWTQHVATCQALLRQAFEYAREAGSLTFAAFARVDLITSLLAIGEPLDAVEREAESALEFVQGARFGLISDVIVAQLRLIRTLRGRTPDVNSFDDEDFSEAAFEQHLASDPRLAVAASRYWIRKLQACIHAGNYAIAVEAASRAASLLWTLPTQLELPEYHFYAAVAHAGRSDAVAPEERDHHLRELKAHRDQIDLWAKNGPENFRHRAALLGAECARLEERELEAMHLYEEAVRSARDQNFIQEEGVASELAAKFHGARGLKTTAQAYLQNAHYCYRRWGAEGKVRQLGQAHPYLAEATSFGPIAGATGMPLEHLDIGSMLKASQAVSGEIVLGRLLETLMTIALEHGGADRGILILIRGDLPQIQADAKIRQQMVEVSLRRGTPVPEKLPLSVLNTAIRTRQSVILDDAQRSSSFSEDEYIRQRSVRSILCLPLMKQAELIGVLYLENTLSPDVFTPARIAVLRLLASQAAFSLENARLYEDLQHAEALLAEAQRLSHTGSFSWEVSSDDLTWSEESFRIFEFEMAPKPTMAAILERVHPADRSVVQDAIDRAKKNRQGFELAHRLLLPSGAVKHLHVVARPEADESGRLRFVGALMDVTPHKQARVALERSENRYRHLFLDMPVALWQLDTEPLIGLFGALRAAGVAELSAYIDANPDFLSRAAELSIIEEANDCAVQMFGARDQRELLGSMEWVWRESPDTLRRVIESRFRGELFFQETTRVPTFDGRVIDVLCTIAHQRTADKLGTILVSLVDLTERVRAQEMLQQVQAEFAHAARISMLGELTASIAHDLTQPLAAITTHGEAGLRWLNQPAPNLEEVRAATTRIVGDARRSVDIIARIRGMAVRRPPERKPISLDELVKETMVFLRHEVQSRAISIMYETKGSGRKVLADRIQLQQVIVNLIVNAIHAMTEFTSPRREITIRVSHPDAVKVRCAVEDSGPGIPPELANRLFESFFTTKEDGMGMGLSICRSIIEAHGGRIAADNESMHGGARFYFTLPTAEALTG
jgi:predicted ATPase/signal transduction histidine kinase/GAF domain-containing protein